MATSNMQRGASDPSLKVLIEQLLGYCRRQGWAGHDPYDALNSRLFAKFPLLDRRWPRLLLTQLLKRLPVDTRGWLDIPPTQNPKGLALCVMALLRLHRSGAVPDLSEAIALGERMIEMRSHGGTADCWGYSFPWQTRTVLVERGAPSLVCTVFVAEALLDLYSATGDTRFATHAKGAACYIRSQLYWTDGASVHALAYPLATSRTPVHNANLLGAAFLCRVASELGVSDLAEVALRVARYSVARQREDGSWLYGEARSQAWIDNFHTGFNLSALASIERSFPTGEFSRAIERGFAYFVPTFIRADGAARYFHDRTFPIDAHSVAQSIITLTEFRHLHPNAARRADDVLQWAVKHMWDPAGFFYYRCYPVGRNKIPYFRWSEAWMLLALAWAWEARQGAAARANAAIGNTTNPVAAMGDRLTEEGVMP